MDILQHLLRLLTYDDWANRTTLASMRAAGDPPAKSLTVAAHIVAVRALWLARLRRETTSFAVWPDLGLDECEAALEQSMNDWKDYLHGLTPADLAESVPYKNSLGEEWANSVEDILIHLAMHNGYHRGQIAADLRAAGHTPVYTDFIYAVRQGKIGK